MIIVLVVLFIFGSKRIEQPEDDMIIMDTVEGNSITPIRSDKKPIGSNLRLRKEEDAFTLILRQFNLL